MPASTQLPLDARPRSAPQLAATAPAPVDASQEFFVRIEDGEFVAGCQRFLLAGKLWWLGLPALGAWAGCIFPPCRWGQLSASPRLF